MAKQSPVTITRGSYFTADSLSCYGEWFNQVILGDGCTIRAKEAPDGDMHFVDALNQPGVFRRGGIAIHVSGFDVFGDKAQPGRIRAMAMYAVTWNRVGHHPSGLGCREQEPAVIVADGAATEKAWSHHVLYGSPRYFWTLEGIYHAFRDTGNFTPEDVVAVANLEGRKLDKQHERSARLMLEACVDASNHGIPDAQALRRFGRWGYTWRPDE